MLKLQDYDALLFYCDKLGGVRVNANVATVSGSIPAPSDTQCDIGTAVRAGLN